MSRTRQQKILDSMRNRGATVQITPELIFAAIESGVELEIDETQIDDVYDAVITHLGTQFVDDFGKKYKENLIEHLDNLERTARKPKDSLKLNVQRLFRDGGSSSETRSLRKQIIDTITLKKETDNEGHYSNVVTIKHPLTQALNYGTGIYGEKRQPITAKSKKYMFIPGVEFARGFTKSAIKRKSPTTSDADAFKQVRTKVRERRSGAMNE